MKLLRLQCLPTGHIVDWVKGCLLTSLSTISRFQRPCIRLRTTRETSKKNSELKVGL